MSKRYFRWRIM